MSIRVVANRSHRGDAEFETSGSETLKTMALVYACYLSAEEGRVVDPKEIVYREAVRHQSPT